MIDPTLFQYCQKIVVFRNDNTEVLLAKRVGETDYNETYSFIGGKMETTDVSILEGICREKNEEVGQNFKIKINATTSYNIRYVKKSGVHMIMPHYYSQYVEGEVNLSDEYSDYRWVPILELESFEPKMETIPRAVQAVLRLKDLLEEEDFVTI